MTFPKVIPWRGLAQTLLLVLWLMAELYADQLGDLPPLLLCEDDESGSPNLHVLAAGLVGGRAKSFGRQSYCT